MTSPISNQGLGAYFQSLVHASVKANPLAATRHQSFIASHLFGGFLALAAFPVYLAGVGQPSVLSAVVFAWSMTPILIAVYLSKTGRLDIAHLISAANLAGLVTFGAALTGGVSSFLIAWMVVVPLEAALSANRRVVLMAIGIALLALAGLAVCGYFAMLPAPRAISYEPALLGFFGSVSALVYAGGLAVAVQGVYNRSEMEIRRGEQRYRLLAENATDMITRHDAQGHVLFASIASEQILGEPAMLLHGKGMLQRIHAADRAAYLTALHRCREIGEPVSVEFRVRTGGIDRPVDIDTADFIWAEMRCRLVSGNCAEEMQHAAAHEIVAVTRDITARKAQEDEILKARDSAETANRSKTQFLANMSHELRTPLNAIIGFSEILNRELYGRIGEERYREYAHLIHESGEHLLSVVNEILDMSKIEAGKFDIVTEYFNVQTLIRSCVEIMRHQGEKKSIDLRMTVAPDLPDLAADKRACKQVLLNLLANAIKFTDNGGKVEVAARQIGEEIELAVSDTGIGIAEQDIPKLGNPFVQAESSYDRKYEGAGLGLSVVKGLVRLHGGSFDIESVLGEGTKVMIRLPIDGNASAQHSQEHEDSKTTAPAPVAMALGA